MKPTLLILLLAASAAIAQTPASPAAGAAKPAAKPAAPATAVHHPASTAAASAVKLPPGVPVVKGIVKPAFTLRYEDIKLGAGADADPGKMYKVLYAGYLGSNGRPDDGHKFDSSDDHRQPLKDKDGKPVLGDDGKPKLGDAQPMAFPQGMGRLIPGFDQGFAGMKVGGKRRIFIPWQLAYGAKGRPGPDPAHPGIPPKADLIFDVELVDVADMPAPPTRPGMGAMPGMPPGARPMPPGAQPLPPGGAPRPLTPGASPAPGTHAPGSPAPGSPAPGSPAAPAPTPAAPAAPATAPAPATPAQPQPH
ncbi:MAG: FKBP-type peptidyl-prolyl cis-trans isomerase [Terracidiphilus sp.]|nr:FKBP-type peptidyl-prolyl cis-trans isomerase [Terracidiphilus sp.]